MKIIIYQVSVPETEDAEFREWIDTHNESKRSICNVQIAEVNSEV